MTARTESNAPGPDAGRDRERPRRPTREQEGERGREVEADRAANLARGSTQVATADIMRARRADGSQPGVEDATGDTVRARRADGSQPGVTPVEIAKTDARRTHPRRASSREITMRGAGRRDPTLFAAVVLAAYLGQAVLQVEVAWLVSWQHDELYRLATGGALAAFLAVQWVLARASRDVHMWLGALAPALLYAHATRFAYGYLAWLVVVYLGVAATGLVHRPIIARRARRLYIAWFIAHLALSVLMLVLVAYHVVIAISYE